MTLTKKRTSAEDNVRKKQASELLRNADKSLRDGNYADAMKEVEKTIELDPNNFYARAYRERIIAAKARAESDAAAEQEIIAKPPAEPSNGIREEKKVETENLRKILEQKRREEEAALRASDVHHPAKIESIETVSPDQQPSDGEARKRADVSRKRVEDELQLRALKSDILQKRGEEERIKAEAARAKLELELQQKEQETQRRIQEERQRVEEETKRVQAEGEQKLVEERRRLQEEAKRKEEAARHKAEEEARMKLEEQRKRLEEERVRLQEETRQKEAAAQKKADEEARVKVEEQRRRMEDDKRRLEAEARRQAEVEAQRKLEEDRRKRVEAERRRKEEEEALKNVEEEGKRQARSKKIQEFLGKAKDFVVQHAFDQAITELMKIYVVNPENSEARQLEQIIRKEQKEAWKQEMEEKKHVPRQAILEMYKQTLMEAWSEGALAPAELRLLENLRSSLQITDADHRQIEPQAKMEAYSQALTRAWENGSSTGDDALNLTRLRRELDIAEEQHLSLETRLRRGRKE